MQKISTSLLYFKNSPKYYNSYTLDIEVKELSFTRLSINSIKLSWQHHTDPKGGFNIELYEW